MELVLRYFYYIGHVIDDVTYFSFDENDGHLIPEVTLDREHISSFSLLIQVSIQFLSNFNKYIVRLLVYSDHAISSEIGLCLTQ